MFHFTIRDVLWLTAVVALILGWWIEYRQNAPLRKRCDRLTTLAENSAKVMQSIGIKAEFRDDNIHIGGYHFERPPTLPPNVNSAATP